MLILAVKEPAEKKQLSCGSWCYSKQTIKGHIFGPFLTYTLLFVKGCFFCPIWPTFHMYPAKTSVIDTDAPLPSEKIGEREFLSPFFLGEGASVNAFFQKRSSRSVDIFVNARLSFSCSCSWRKPSVFILDPEKDPRVEDWLWCGLQDLVSPRVRLRSSLFPWTTFKTAKLLTSVDFNLPHPGLWTGFF